MIKAQQGFSSTSDLKGHGFCGSKVFVLYLISENYSLSLLSERVYFLEVGPVHETLRYFNVR